MNEKALQKKAAELEQMLRVIANQRRLLILCKLLEQREANVALLSRAARLSQSAVSQHLAKMRQAKLVSFRRKSQTIWYRIADSRIEKLFASLERIFCPPRKKRR